uniref:Macaca fascicularis brain cDNA clone: QflA-18203, similar to human nuclear factor I/B (NFIB), mRNA, RefSeq: NM_005596.1 n=1 Tax=Macaca fascicularis TaxID=9541 RepID=I7GLG3_MACFA|nr:unnamed protein product [Macaca fascicularis]
MCLRKIKLMKTQHLCWFSCSLLGGRIYLFKITGCIKNP